jgi:hypothetical protein
MCQLGRQNFDWPDDAEWGCDYCRNDGKLNENNVCPKCDAQYLDDDDDEEPPHDR